MRSLTLLTITLLATYLGTPIVAAEQSQRLQSPPHQVALVELYTSEGCSSCPPADKWMSQLKRDERLWNAVVPVAFHVDYWDYIGWPDRFASATYSNRHRDYGRYAGLRSIYTPGFLVQGKEWRGWFRHPSLKLDRATAVGVITLDVAADGARVAASFDATSPLSPQALELHLAVLGFDLETKVQAGENSGRVLKHDFVVLGYHSTALRGSGPRFSAATSLPTLSSASPRRALAAWVSHKGNPTPLQAVGGWLQN